MRSIVLPVVLASGLAACQTAPVANSGFLSTYDGLTARENTVRASVRERRDDALAQTVDRVFIEPTALGAGSTEGLTQADIALVLGEIDRQICYEVSERFAVLDAPAADAGRIRTVVTAVRPTGAAGSALSAAANFFIPGPIGVRTPGTTGGLATEAEMLTADGRQAAALAWARNATVVGTDSPSLSAVGDALQLAEPLGDAIGDAFAPPDRAVRPIQKPDPCARFGPRNRPEGFLARLATGLYVPQLSGARAEPEQAEPEPRP